MRNLVNLVKEACGVSTDLEVKMFEILENNISDYDNLEDVKNYMENDAICSTGAVSGLIYYSETKEIFKEHFEEILEKLEEYQNDNGKVNFELTYNNLVWFTFENMVRSWYYSGVDELEETEEETEE